MNGQHERDPLEAIELIKFRDSRNGGRPWVKPSFLASHTQQARANASLTRLPATVAATAVLKYSVAVQGVTVGSSEALVKVMMQQVLRVTGLPLVEHTGSAELKKHEWEAIKDFGGKWTGRINIQAGSQDEIATVFSVIHGSGLEADGVCYPVEVTSPFAHLGAPPLGPPVAPPGLHVSAAAASAASDSILNSVIFSAAAASGQQRQAPGNGNEDVEMEAPPGLIHSQI